MIDRSDYILTERLLLRRWSEADAVVLLPVLETNASHLNGWIPQRVAAAVPLPELQARLAAFDADFEMARSWRFAVFSQDQSELYGEVDLFFRSAQERVALPEADRLEIGYWLRSDVVGRGYATEAARALLDLASRLPGMKHVEIRCDARNQESAAVARRLGFRLVEQGSADAKPPADMIWICEFSSAFAP